MSTPRIPAPLQSPASPSVEARPVLRAKTIATRVTPEELAEVEAAAEGAGKTVAEWLRELALKAARERPADPTELMLAEVSALRYMLLNLFHATAQANAEGKHLLPDSVLKIRDQANTRKLADARKLARGVSVPGGTGRGQAVSRPMRFPKPDGAAVLVSFLACGWPACPHLPGFGLALLDARPAPKGLPYDLCRQLCWGRDAAQRNDDPMGDEDRTQAEADSCFRRGCSHRPGPETARQSLAQSHRGGMARSGLQRPGESTRRQSRQRIAGLRL